MEQEAFIILVYKNLKGEISTEERSQLNQWTLDRPAYQQLREEIEASWDLSGSEPQIVTSSDTQRLVQRMRAEGSPNRGFRIWPYVLAAAATIALLIGVRTVHSPDWDRFNQAGDYALQDGTEITLRSGSEMSKKYTASSRLIQLEGEAFFNVARDVDRPFHIQTERADIIVLGTSFLVKEKGDSTYLRVYSGRVKFIDRRTDNSLIVEKDGMVLITSAAGITQEAVSLDLAAWREAGHDFRNRTLGSIVDELSLVYDADITIESSSLADCSVSAYVRGNTVEELLQQLILPFGADLESNRNRWTIRAGACQ